MAGQETSRTTPADDKTLGTGGGKPTSAGQADAGADAGNGDAGSAVDPRIVTAEKLRGALEHQQAETRKAIEKSIGSVKDSFTDIIKTTVSELIQADRVIGDKKQPEKDVELSSLKRQLDEARIETQKLVSELTKKREEEKKMRNKQRILESLNKHGCTNSERAYRAIKDDLTHDEETDTLFITVKNEYGGESRVGYDDYIKNEVRQNVLPELFRGMNRAGSPAEGDQSVGSRRYKYDWKNVKSKPDITTSEDFIKAVAAGEVANWPVTAPGNSMSGVA